MTPVRRAPMKRRTPAKHRTPEQYHTSMREYSKIVLNAMIVLWFAGAVFGAVIVVIQVVRSSYMSDLSSLLMYIGGPMTGGIVGYLIKSALENREKVKHSAELQSYTDNLQQPSDTYIP